MTEALHWTPAAWAAVIAAATLLMLGISRILIITAATLMVPARFRPDSRTTLIRIIRAAQWISLGVLLLSLVSWIEALHAGEQSPAGLLTTLIAALVFATLPELASALLGERASTRTRSAAHATIPPLRHIHGH